MARPKRVVVHTFTAGPSDAARAELWEGIDRILVFANLYRDHDVHRVLTLMSEATDRWYDGDKQTFTFHLPGAWPPGAVIALINLAAILRRSIPRLYLRRCPECQLWCLTKNRKQKRKCHRRACAKAADCRRAGEWQRHQRQEQKDALARIRASRTR